MRHAGILTGLIVALGLGAALWFTLQFVQNPRGYEMSAVGETSCVLLDERTRAIIVKGVDDALHDYIKNMFTVMLQDRAGGPVRALAGARAAIENHTKRLRN